MLSLAALAGLAHDHREELDLPVAPLCVGDRLFDVDTSPVIMGCVNLSRDSTYRESIAVSAGAAIRKARVMAAQGAAIVDLGAESSTAAAERVPASSQSDALVPVVEELAASDTIISVESYAPSVVHDCLKAGARVVNLTGATDEEEIFDLAARYGATVILCYVAGANVRVITDATASDDPMPELLDHFTARVAKARAHGVSNIVIDPGMGFFYGNLVDPAVRVQHQARVLLSTFRLRRLGLPVCQAMPHAFDLFGDQFRTAEGFFTTLAYLGGTSVYRTHEVPHVRAVLDAMALLHA
ncbi:MAG: dihydropteroate synthase [Actinobacteria bacterium]|nr:dihydropteroate synthase [Actinomycetota bacterium]